MASQTVRATPTDAKGLRDDPLDYLKCSRIAEFRRGETIYGPLCPVKGLYLVIDGQVQVSRVQANGRQVALDIYQPDDIFGESVLVAGWQDNETAVALNDVKLMMWTASEIENRIADQPRLGLALAQLVARRLGSLGNRVVGFSSENVAIRIARRLVEFAERFGDDGENGYVRMPPVKHETLAQFVGTSREVVTLKLQVLKAAGCLQYSRTGMIVNRDALGQWLQSAATGEVAATRSA